METGQDSFWETAHPNQIPQAHRDRQYDGMTIIEAAIRVSRDFDMSPQQAGLKERERSDYAKDFVTRHIEMWKHAEREGKTPAITHDIHEITEYFGFKVSDFVIGPENPSMYERRAALKAPTA
jgi:hypothetical protein